MPKDKIEIARAAKSDADEFMDLYESTVRNVNSADYSPAQITAWLSGMRNIELWHKKILRQYFLKALIEGRIVGFASLEDNGYLDYMYVHKDCQGIGVARSLLQELEDRAVGLGLKKIWAHVSLTARPFFRKNGFSVTREFVTEKDGVRFEDCEMTKVF